MSMLFVHFKNLHFAKWTNIPRKRDIFYYKRLHTSLRRWHCRFDKKLHKSTALCNFS